MIGKSRKQRTEGRVLTEEPKSQRIEEPKNERTKKLKNKCSSVFQFISFLIASRELRNAKLQNRHSRDNYRF